MTRPWPSRYSQASSRRRRPRRIHARRIGPQNVYTLGTSRQDWPHGCARQERRMAWRWVRGWSTVTQCRPLVGAATETRMPEQTKVDAGLYARLLSAYRVQPGVYANAAREAGCGVKLAKAGWLKGWVRAGQRYPAIQGVIEREQRDARAKLADEQRLEDEQVAERGQASRIRAAELDEQRREDAVESRKREGQVVRAAQGAAAVVLKQATGLLAASMPMADALRTMLMQQTGIELHEGMRVLEGLSKFSERGVRLAAAAMQLERTHLGDAFGRDALDTAEMSTDEALREIEAAAAARESYARRAGGLRVVPPADAADG